jgi:hypothetical protein
MDFPADHFNTDDEDCRGDCCGFFAALRSRRDSI